jgi:fumarylacetoacetase
MGAIIGKSNQIGRNVKVSEASDYVFGFVILNDWSARDIQTWEYVPLGPFTAKNFASTISPWIITVDALEPFSVQLPKQDPEPLRYLQEENLRSWDIPIYTSISTQSQKVNHVISETNYRYMYWSVNQQVAHHTVTGCKLNVGDMLGSGTISGTDENSYGSLFELSQGGTKKIKVGNEERIWIEDGDVITMTAVAKGNGFNIGFGNCSGEILPANPENEYY